MSEVNELFADHYVEGDLVYLGVQYGTVERWVGLVVKAGTVDSQDHSYQEFEHPMVSWYDPRIPELTPPARANFRNMELIGRLPEGVLWDV